MGERNILRESALLAFHARAVGINLRNFDRLHEIQPRIILYKRAAVRDFFNGINAGFADIRRRFFFSSPLCLSFLNDMPKANTC